MYHFTYSSVLITLLVIEHLKLLQRQRLRGKRNGDSINGYNITMEVYCTFNILNIIFVGEKILLEMNW
jgi:hypothetical protein